ncbi:MAG: hypothetical protein RID53_04755 [Coleofasciculus sp. B1-GNL1-01]|uniref:hypothetical protein n=1 Tax=Coleofasciculus sp. B1-GNL1-01 TaxID=3068484 RepID=UPI0032F94A10
MANTQSVWGILTWVLVASKMQSLRHGFAKRTTRLSPLLILRFKCRTAYLQNLMRMALTGMLVGFDFAQPTLLA